MKVRLLVVFLFVLLFGYAVYLFVALRKSSESLKLPSIASPAEKDVPSGEIILNKPGRDTDLPYEVLVLSQLFLKNHKVYPANDGKTPMVDLELGFVKDGQEKSFTVTLVGKVSYRITRADGGTVGTEDKGIVDVDTPEYVKGERLSITLEYVTNKDEALKYFERSCSRNSGNVVCGYLTEGYGSQAFTKEEFGQLMATDEKRLLPSQVVISGLTRSLQYPNL